MKKSLVVASLLVLGVSSAVADVKSYVGASAGVAWDKVDTKANAGVISASASKRKSAFLPQLKIGAIYNDTHRISAVYTPSIHSDAKIHRLLGSYDYILKAGDSSKLYAGLHAGYTKANMDDGPDASGAAYGLQAGYIHDISDSLEFELGAMYTRYSVDKSYTDSNFGFPIEVKYELKDTISTFVGINYKF